MPAPPRTFAEMVDGAAREKGLNDYQLSAAIGLMPGNRVCSPKQVARIRAGQQVNYRAELIDRLIVVLDLDPNEAWPLSGVSPPDLTPEHLRQLGLFAGRRRRADREIEQASTPAGAVVRAETGRNGDCTEALGQTARAAA
jgi:hypothetical protein